MNNIYFVTQILQLVCTVHTINVDPYPVIISGFKYIYSTWSFWIENVDTRRLYTYKYTHYKHRHISEF
jgi:hypothetical protein